MTKSRSEDRFEPLFQAEMKKSRRYLVLMPKTEDVILMTLKGHLIVEEMLYTMLATYCTDRARLEDVGLGH